MEGKSCSSSKSHDSYDGGETVAVVQLKKMPKLGEVIGVKLSDGSWWPAVVVEGNISGSNKSGNGLMADVRVRLYGSYEYMYVDPVKQYSEFRIILEQKNGCYEEVFKKTLEQNLSSTKSGVKRKVAKSKGVEYVISKAPNHRRDGVKRKLKLKSPNTTENSKRKSSKHDEAKQSEEHDKGQRRAKQSKQGGKQKHDPNSTRTTELSGRSTEPSARKTKVMQNLGLIAPSGSPFQKTDAVL